ncbi:MAG TPA: phosphoribosylglycinamide formyltransferase [Planctomycetes bacterium]|nr:phosphoribosylglycinamide formyltransferase [Planctomycetota bacterium]
MTGNGRRVTVLISGTGRSLENLIALRDAGELNCDFARVVSSRAGVRGLTVAEEAGIPTTVVARKEHFGTQVFSEALTAVVMADRPDWIVMAGFLSLWLLPESLLGKVINIHPSLLPLFGGKGFYGHHVHEAVIASGMRISGCTVHFVDTRYDKGPIIHQRCCPVFPADTPDDLASRVFGEECRALPEALRWCLDGEVALGEGRVLYSDRLLRPSGQAEDEG